MRTVSTGHSAGATPRTGTLNSRDIHMSHHTSMSNGSQLVGSERGGGNAAFDVGGRGGRTSNSDSSQNGVPPSQSRSLHTFRIGSEREGDEQLRLKDPSMNHQAEVTVQRKTSMSDTRTGALDDFNCTYYSNKTNEHDDIFGVAGGTAASGANTLPRSSAIDQNTKHASYYHDATSQDSYQLTESRDSLDFDRACPASRDSLDFDLAGVVDVPFTDSGIDDKRLICELEKERRLRDEPSMEVDSCGINVKQSQNDASEHLTTNKNGEELTNILDHEKQENQEITERSQSDERLERSSSKTESHRRKRLSRENAVRLENEEMSSNPDLTCVIVESKTNNSDDRDANLEEDQMREKQHVTDENIVIISESEPRFDVKREDVSEVESSVHIDQSIKNESNDEGVQSVEIMNSEQYRGVLPVFSLSVDKENEFNPPSSSDKSFYEPNVDELKDQSTEFKSIPESSVEIEPEVKLAVVTNEVKSDVLGDKNSGEEEIMYILHKRHLISVGEQTDESFFAENRYASLPSSFYRSRSASPGRSRRSQYVPSTLQMQEQHRTQMEKIKTSLVSMANSPINTLHSPSGGARKGFDFVVYNKLPPRDSFSSKDDSLSPPFEKEIASIRAKVKQRSKSEKRKKDCTIVRLPAPLEIVDVSDNLLKDTIAEIDTNEALNYSDTQEGKSQHEVEYICSSREAEGSEGISRIPIECNLSENVNDVKSDKISATMETEDLGNTNVITEEISRNETTPSDAYESNTFEITTIDVTAAEVRSSEVTESENNSLGSIAPAAAAAPDTVQCSSSDADVDTMNPETDNNDFVKHPNIESSTEETVSVDDTFVKEIAERIVATASASALNYFASCSEEPFEKSSESRDSFDELPPSENVESQFPESPAKYQANTLVTTVIASVLAMKESAEVVLTSTVSNESISTLPLSLVEEQPSTTSVSNEEDLICKVVSKRSKVPPAVKPKTKPLPRVGKVQINAAVDDSIPISLPEAHLNSPTRSISFQELLPESYESRITPFSVSAFETKKLSSAMGRCEKPTPMRLEHELLQSQSKLNTRDEASQDEIVSAELLPESSKELSASEVRLKAGSSGSQLPLISEENTEISLNMSETKQPCSKSLEADEGHNAVSEAIININKVSDFAICSNLARMSSPSADKLPPLSFHASELPSPKQIERLPLSNERKGESHELKEQFNVLTDLQPLPNEIHSVVDRPLEIPDENIRDELYPEFPPPPAELDENRDFVHLPEIHSFTGLSDVELSRRLADMQLRRASTDSLPPPPPPWVSGDDTDNLDAANWCVSENSTAPLPSAASGVEISDNDALQISSVLQETSCIPSLPIPESFPVLSNAKEVIKSDFSYEQRLNDVLKESEADISQASSHSLNDELEGHLANQPSCSAWFSPPSRNHRNSPEFTRHGHVMEWLEEQALLNPLPPFGDISDEDEVERPHLERSINDVFKDLEAEVSSQQSIAPMATGGCFFPTHLVEEDLSSEDDVFHASASNFADTQNCPTKSLVSTRGVKPFTGNQKSSVLPSIGDQSLSRCVLSGNYSSDEDIVYPLEANFADTQEILAISAAKNPFSVPVAMDYRFPTLPLSISSEDDVEIPHIEDIPDAMDILESVGMSGQVYVVSNDVAQPALLDLSSESCGVLSDDEPADVGDILDSSVVDTLNAEATTKAPIMLSASTQKSPESNASNAFSDRTREICRNTTVESRKNIGIDLSSGTSSDELAQLEVLEELDALVVLEEIEELSAHSCDQSGAQQISTNIGHAECESSFGSTALHGSSSNSQVSKPVSDSYAQNKGAMMTASSECTSGVISSPRSGVSSSWRYGSRTDEEKDLSDVQGLSLPSGVCGTSDSRVTDSRKIVQKKVCPSTIKKTTALAVSTSHLPIVSSNTTCSVTPTTPFDQKNVDTVELPITVFVKQLGSYSVPKSYLN